MISTIARHVGLIDGTAVDWVAATRQQIESGGNFLLILANSRDAIADFCKAFEMAPDCDPTPMPRHALVSMSQYLEDEVFNRALQAQDEGQRVVFIDQLDLALTKPPRVKPYLVYSAIWGIISQHEELRGARESLEDYSFTFYRFRRNPEAGIYRWIDGKWQLLDIH
jgi:hypothetical protein